MTGHFGSGKTEFAINLAMQQKGKTVILDMDIVNPYYRTADASLELEKHGVEVILPLFANTNVDIPTLPGEILSVFANKDKTAVFDIGGDEDGAIALGRFHRFFKEEPYEMYFVINERRPLTDNKEAVIEMMHAVEGTSRLKITHLVNCTHLGRDTTPEIVLKGQSLAEAVSLETGIPIAYTAVKKGINIAVNNPLMELQLYIKAPF